MAGSLDPKMTMVGRPKAAAMWAGPESLPMKREADARSDLISARGASEIVRYARKGERSSVGLPMKTGSMPEAARKFATARKFGAGQVFSAVAATGWMMALVGQVTDLPGGSVTRPTN